jgi:hypothetical protein
LRTIAIPLKNIKNYGPKDFVVLKFLPKKIGFNDSLIYKLLKKTIIRHFVKFSFEINSFIKKPKPRLLTKSNNHPTLL